MQKSLRFLMGTGVALLSACSSVSYQDSSLVRRLRNQGPVALSTDNPYLRGNLLVSEIADKSDVVRGFINHRGPPPAVEVIKSMFSKLELQFYYPQEREYYILEQLEEDWSIEGPHRIPKEEAEVINDLTRDLRGTPVLTDQIPPPRKSFQSAKTEEREVDQGPPIEQSETPEPRPLPPVAKIDSGSITKPKAALKIETPPPRGQKTLDEVRKASEGQPAEISPKGDLVHYVTYAGETLSMIARWYTLERENVGRLIRINRLSSPNNLSIGDTIVIPSYLVKFKNRLSEDAVKVLATVAQSELNN